MEIFNYRYDDLFEPTIKSLHILGGSGSTQEIEESIVKLLNLSDEKTNAIHHGNITQLSYQLAWATDFLRCADYISYSLQGVWSLTRQGINANNIDKEEIKRLAKLRNSNLEYHEDLELEVTSNDVTSNMDWQQKVLDILKGIPPHKFERLCQRLLRELGFINVEVTGKVGDGGIDGKGVYRVGSVMSFHVVFQCKRYFGAVSSSEVRDFRGAFVGRADKGLVITTGAFTRDARKEAQRDGAPPVDLIDGLELAEKLRELNLGVETELIERVTVSADWFSNF